MPCISGIVDPLSGLIAEVRIGVTPEAAQAMQDGGQTVPAPAKVRAVLDTGAHISAVDSGLLQELGIKPTGFQEVVTATTGRQPTRQPSYEVQIFFPRADKKPTRNRATVVGIDLGARAFSVVLGRDCLQLGLLVYDGPAWKFTFAYDCE